MRGGIGIPELLIILVIVIICYLPLILYLLTLSKTLEAVSPRNRTMSPGLVWLNLIPIFVLGWHFYTVVQMRNSLGAEYAERGIPDPGRGGYGIGMAASILYVCSIIPYLGVLALLGGLVCWIIYWVKMAGYKKALLLQGQLSAAGVGTPSTPPPPPIPR